ncbi:hypothetical protein [Reyranella soli]|uniref:Uncharacterized protein n=1 Tax=Reyranella soli TaxID=1230389 RepID=A0A512NSM1_9HYPH|nr:hypothetical protein [Reyranella soli]GEP61939.1 hypothetical protein RSO01_91050 [Reyranella soli]
MDYVTQPVAVARLDHDMDVIWHDVPTEHAIAFTVEVQDDILDQLGDGWLP